MGEPEINPSPGQPSVVSIESAEMGKRKCMIPQNLQRKQYIRAPKARQKAAGDSDLPVRITSCIFQRPVTLISAHPGGEVRRGPHEEKLEKAQQLCASWRLQAVKHRGTEEERESQSDFAKASRLMTLGHRRGSLGHSAVGSLQPTPGLSPFWKEMIPEASHLVPPSYNHQVTSADIQSQMEKVKKARQRLAAALQADRLAREAERRRGQEEGAAAQLGAEREPLEQPGPEAAGEGLS